MIAAGNHSLFIKSDGTLWAWGNNGYGQLGDGTTTNRSVPVQVGTATNWASVAAGENHSVALKTDGTLWAWGYNYYGQLGDNTTTTRYAPVQIGTDTHWAAVAAGENHTVALKTDGTLWAWGYNYYGQLGDNTTTTRYAPVQIGTATWTSITAGDYHTAAIGSDGTLWTWGYNGYGQLGDGTTTTRYSPVQIASAVNWSAVAAGGIQGYHTVAIKADGTLWAWGYNYYGQLGDNTTTQRNAPVQIGTGTTWASVSANHYNSAAIKTDGTLWTWGYNSNGQIGDGTTTQSNAPVQVGTAANWAAVSVGFAHTMALTTGGMLWDWGYNNYGQIGDGTTTQRNFPVLISQQISITPSFKNFGNIEALTQSTATPFTISNSGSFNLNVGAISRTGLNTSEFVIQSDACSSQTLAPGGSCTIKVAFAPATTGAKSAALSIPSNDPNYPLSAVSLSGTGTDYTLNVIRTGMGSVKGSGLNCGFICSNGYNSGSVITLASTPAPGYTFAGWSGGGCSGTGTCSITMSGDTVVTATFTASASGLTTVAIAAGDDNARAIANDGTLWSWGYNNNGQLGDGTTTARSYPVKIGTNTNWVAVSASCSSGSNPQHTAALRSDGTLWAWGANNYGQLGNGTTTQSNSPVQIGTDSDWAGVSAGQYHTAAIKTDGTLWSWGNNSFGQLGNGTTVNRSTPAIVGTGSTWAAVSAGQYHTAAIKTDGTLWAWGYNSNGQLGDGTTTNRSLPVQIGTATNWAAVSSGYLQTLAIKTDGTLWAWGYNGYGQLGDGTTTQQTAPVQIGSAINWAYISAGQYHSLAVKTDGTLWAWGYNLHGEVGDGTTIQRNAPVQIGTAVNWAAVAAGGNYFSLGLKTDGTVWSWGNNSAGQLGDGTTTQQNAPELIAQHISVFPISKDFGNVKAGGQSNPVNFYITNTGSFPLGIGAINLTGANASEFIIQNDPCSNQTLAVGAICTLSVSFSPASTGAKSANLSVPSSDPDNPTATIALSGTGTDYGLAVIKSGMGKVTGAGINCGFDCYEGLNSGAVETLSATPAIGVTFAGWSGGGCSGTGTCTVTMSADATVSATFVAPIPATTAISAGSGHTVTIRSDGTLWAWGNNGYGQLGDGTTTTKNTPVQIGTGTTWAAVSAGYLHTVAIKDDGTLWAWGYNSNGQLGDGTTTGRYSPVQVGTDTDWVAVSAGQYFTVGLKTDGTLWAWGYNGNGQLGQGTSDSNPHPSPVRIGTDTNWVTFATGSDHTLAIKTDGTLWAWGGNAYGKLGDGTLTSRYSPVQIGTGTNWAAVAAPSGGLYSLAIKTDGTLWAWGYNGYGQLGDGTTTTRLSPVQIGSGTNWAVIAAGADHAVAIKTDGTLWAWGYNGYGQLGDGTTTQRLSPVQIGTAANWAAIAAGDSHTVALTTDGTLWVWGYNNYGQLGDGTYTNKTSPLAIVIITATAGPGGAITPSGTLSLAGGASQTFTITPSAGGYYIVDVLVDGTSVGVVPTYTFTNLTANHTISASFASTPVCSPITVSPPSLPNGTQGASYSQTITASGGTGPYTYAVTSGSLPNGLSLSTGGAITGTPTAAGTYTFTITATDTATSCTGSQTYTLTINCPSITLSPSTLPDGVQNTAYNQTVSASSGTSPYTYAVTLGSLPTGLTLYPSSGVISNAPTAAGLYSFTVTATDSYNCAGSQAYSVQVWSNTCYAQPSGLVAWWPGNGNANDVVNGNNGTLMNGTTYGAGKDGQAFLLDGVNDYISIPDSSALRPTNVTVSAWVYFNSLDSTISGGAPAGEQYLIHKNNSRTVSQTEGYTLNKYRSAGQDYLSFVISSATGTQAIASSFTPVVAGQWYHVVGTYDGSMAKLYFNGSLQGQTPATFALDYGNYPLIIGATNQPTEWDGKLNGLIDEVQIYNRALTDTEIAAIYNAGSNGVCPDTTAPTLSPVHIASNNADPTKAVVGDIVTLTFTSSEGITTPAVTIEGTTAAVTGGPTNWSASYTIQAADAIGPVTFTISSYSDFAGNAGSAVSSATDGSSVSKIAGDPGVTQWPTASAITYGQTLASSTLSGGSASVSGTFAFTTSSTAPNAGTSSQSVTFTPADTTNYNTVTGTTSVTVSQATVTPLITANNKQYDGTRTATIASHSLTGVIGTDDVSLTGGVASFADPNVGTGKTVTATGLSLSGTTAGNYQLSSATATTTADITSAIVTPVVTVNNKPYDGTTAATIATRSLLGVIGTDDVTLTGGVASFADPNVGTGKTVTVTGLSLSGVTASNYQLSSTTATTTADITDTAPVFSSTTPGSNSYINTTTVGYTLSKDVASGTITFTRTGGSPDALSPHTYPFTAPDLTAGSHSVTTGLSLVNGAIYSVSFDAVDAVGTSAVTVANTNILYDTTAASVTLDSPVSGSRTNNTQVSFTLSKDAASARIVYTNTGGTSDGTSPHTYNLSGAELTSGSHTVTTNLPLVDGAVYTVDIENVVDLEGNVSAVVSNTNVTYDTTAVAITNTSPAAGSYITTADASYTLSEQSFSGTITFTRTGGATDAGSPHIYTMSGTDLTIGAHSINTVLTLVSGSIYTVSFNATDMAGNAATTISSANVTYAPACPTVTLTSSTLPNGTKGTAYSQTITASGGILPYTFTSTGLPSWLTLSPSGALTGTPTATGTFNFAVTAIDANGCTSAAQSFTIIVSCPSITISPTTLSGTAGASFTGSVTATGGTGPYTYSTTSTMPAGLRLNANGSITGTPTASGSTTIAVTATDNSGCASALQNVTISISCPTITLSPTSLSNATKGTAYRQGIIASNGGTMYTISSGSLPPGIQIVNGVLMGTPTAVGTYNFTITVADSNGCSGSQAYTLVITAPACPIVTLTPSTLSNGTKGTAYSQTIAASGGLSPYTFTSTGLPSWLTLSPSGALTGTPTATGTFNFTVTATDANGCTSSAQSYTVVVNAPPCPTITLSPATLPNGTKGTAYNQTVVATGGATPYSFMATGLPTWLSFSSAGLLSGTPTATGTFNFTVTATDTNNCSGSDAYTLTIAETPKIAISPSSLVNFGSVNLGKTAMKKFIVANEGDGDLVISAVGVGKSLDFSQTNDCATLAPRSFCEVDVTFDPLSQGRKKDVLVVESNDPAAPLHNVPLTGYGNSVWGIAYITNSLVNMVACVDDGSLSESTNVGHTPLGVAVSPLGDVVYVTNHNGNTVSVISTATNQVVSTIEVGISPTGVAASPKGDLVYVANYGSGSVSVINATLRHVIASIRTGSGPSGVAVGPDGRILYVTGYLSDKVSIIDTETRITAATVDVGLEPYGVAVSPSGTVVYVANFGSNTVSAIDASTHKVIGTVAVGLNPAGLALDPAGEKLYVTNFGGDTVTVIGTSTLSVVDTVQVGTRPFGVSVNSDGLVYVVNWGSGSISVISPSTGNVTDTIFVGNGPISFGNFILP